MKCCGKVEVEIKTPDEVVNLCSRFTGANGHQQEALDQLEYIHSVFGTRIWHQDLDKALLTERSIENTFFSF